MTVSEDPRLVDLDEILEEEQAVSTHVAPLQWALIVIAGVVGIGGLLAVLVVAAPALLALATWINAITRAVSGG
jgi:hypothetical protein